MSVDIEEARFRFVREVQQETRVCIDRVLRESDRLRALLESADFDRKQLQCKLDSVTKERDEMQAEVSRLTKSLTEIESEHESFFEGYARVEEKSTSLANLYVATYRLHGSHDSEEVLDVIEEIVANLIGSEEIAILRLDSSHSGIEVLRASGVDRARLESIELGEGIIGRSLVSGEQYIRKDEPAAAADLESADDELTACVPLRIGGRLFGAIAIFELLGQKPGLEEIDFEFFELLGEQAGVALYAAFLAAGDSASEVLAPAGAQS